MSLRSKIVMILVAVVALYAALDNASLRLFAGPIFEKWELEAARDELDVVLRRLRGRLDEMEDVVRILAAVPSRADGKGSSLDWLSGDVMEQAGIDLLLHCGPGGKVLWRRIVHPDTGQELDLREFPAEQLGPNRRILNFVEGGVSQAGVVFTDMGPLLVASAAVGDVVEEGQGGRLRKGKLGTVIAGSFLTRGRLEAVAGSAEGQVIVHDPTSPETDIPEEVLNQMTAAGRGAVDQVGPDGYLHLYTAQLADLRTGAPLVVEAVLNREISRRGRRSMDYALVSTLAGTFLVLFVLLFLLQRIVIRPISELTHKTVEIGREDDPTIRVGMERSDEIGQLASEFDGMMEKLEESRAQVVRSARLAGMSEIATGILHNVGNVLNSVNVSASMLQRRATKLPTEDLARLVKVLEPHADDLAGFVERDPRGKHLFPLLKGLGETLDGEKQVLLEEVVGLTKGLEHIAELVRSQQGFAVSKGVFEKVVLHQEVDRAIGIVQRGFAEGNVRIIREYADIPSVTVDRNKLLEILVNLLQNAKQATTASDRTARIVTVRIIGGENRVRIEVVDNGVGIPPEHTSRIFQHGFTTKENGHGFGLHVSANAAKEMGGSLWAESEGVGRGATFCLELPLIRKETATAVMN